MRALKSVKKIVYPPEAGIGGLTIWTPLKSVRKNCQTWQILLCMLMTNFKVVGKKSTKLWSFYVFVFLAFFVLKNLKIKNIFSKGYVRIN